MRLWRSWGGCTTCGSLKKWTFSSEFNLDGTWILEVDQSPFSWSSHCTQKAFFAGLGFKIQNWHAPRWSSHSSLVLRLKQIRQLFSRKRNSKWFGHFCTWHSGLGCTSLRRFSSLLGSRRLLRHTVIVEPNGSFDTSAARNPMDLLTNLEVLRSRHTSTPTMPVTLMTASRCLGLWWNLLTRLAFGVPKNSRRLHCLLVNHNTMLFLWLLRKRYGWGEL